MKVNFHMSEVVHLYLDVKDVHDISHLFGWLSWFFPLKYLGISLSHEKLGERRDIHPLVDKI
jgi:hypothetical protein